MYTHLPHMRQMSLPWDHASFRGFGLLILVSIFDDRLLVFIGFGAILGGVFVISILIGFFSSSTSFVNIQK